MIRCAIPIGAVLLCGSALAAESYLCVADQATGFALNKTTGDWETTSFPNGSKYLVSKSGLENFAFDVKVVGQTAPSAVCKDDFNEAGYLICKAGLLQFRFNRSNGRFLAVSDLGYWNPPKGDLGKEGAVTPYMEIGKCSPL